ncbi:3-hydroxyacyl-CoA dehydrogenase NAD-binding domain-containing protein [Rhodococcus sp. T2V]|uniref:3-hydroxyacyl-CoA dehydrogenase NAD-binding domain-containing protein n=1 Tax=Rhodococcus sp. T2V TaxID=3034164 RepID=UPI0023E2DB19|nr:3-hydroxyacyl-CoA dehydrogenase NAD-binding domain-containing protein [Rhodococcus sp. T2V]MDF3311460.1 3-hydroxyacyl-CoA dehydrogenase NAD-binding domain-containing protein [Rhodococcus sp. T2V]
MSVGEIGDANALVHLEREGEVAILVLDNPPVNTSTARLRAGVLHALENASRDAGVSAIVLIGAGRHFVSGSDLHEFDGDLPTPELTEVIAAIEACPKPVVAALAGSTLGGGFELALACDARVGLAGGVLGLPEVTLGMIPGAGGTQRTLRLLPPSRALELITSGESITIEQAHDEGLVDEVVSGSLRREAVAFARRVSAKRILRRHRVLTDAPGAVETAAQRALARYGPRPAITATIGAILTGLVLPTDSALRHERAEFNRLRNSSEAAARRHLFFARTFARKTARVADAHPVAHVGVIGAGRMGTGIARAFIEAGVQVTIIDQDPAATTRAKAALERSYARQVLADRLRVDKADQRLALLTPATGVGDLASAHLVIEAVVDDHLVKAKVLAEVAGVVEDGVPLATNTSYLDIDALAAELPDPSSLVGMHFFSPAHRSQVVEIVRGQHTSNATVESALMAARAIGKLPVIAGACEGFIGNRIYNAYRRQCELLVEDGATPEAVDAAMTAFGFAMGPFAVSDMAGLDIAWRNRRRRDSARDPRERYPDVADRLVDKGRLGQKTGAGWYRYEPGSHQPLTDPLVHEIIATSREDKGITPRDIDTSEIVDRALTSMANEAALLLAEGTASTPSDVDLILTQGYGFPEAEGGICYWTSRQENNILQRSRQLLADATGWGFQTGDMTLLSIGQEKRRSHSASGYTADLHRTTPSTDKTGSL